MKTLEAEKLEDKLISIQRVIVAVDLTEHSVATAHYAARIAKWFGASLYVAHVFAPETLYVFGSAGTGNLADQSVGNCAQLGDLTEQVQKIVPICGRFSRRKAAEQISALARDVDADLIVEESRSEVSWPPTQLDKAPQIIHRAPCPVLVYHEKH